LGREAEEEGKKTVNYDLNGFERFSGTLRVSEGGERRVRQEVKGGGGVL
jgi:hypothetical protein